MISLNIILLFFIVSNDSNVNYSPDKLLRLAETGLEYNQDLYGLARLRYIVSKYPGSEYANEAFKELYQYYKEEDELISAFMVLEEFQTQFFDDPFIAEKLDNLGWLYLKSGDYERSLRIYHKLSTDYPESEEVKDNEDFILYVEYMAMGSSSIIGNFLWRIRLSLYFLLDKFEIPYDIISNFFFLILKSFVFLFIMTLSYVLFFSKKQNQELTFWSSNDSAFVIIFLSSFALYVIFYFVGYRFFVDDTGDMPRFFENLSLSFLAFFLFKKNNPDYKNYFRLNLAKLRKSLVIFFVGFIVLFIVIVISGFIYSRTSASIVSRDLDGNVRTSIAFPLTIFRFFLVVLLAPIVEEITYRGLLYESLKEKVGIVYGVVFSSLFFALMHEFTNVTFFYLFGLGIVLALIFQRTKSLTLVMLLHSFFGILSLLRYLNG